MFEFGIYVENGESAGNYTKYGVLPLKVADLLDEQLDEAEIQLKRCPVGYFYPNTVVRIEITNTPSVKHTSATWETKKANAEISGITYTKNADNTLTETYTKYFVIANDNAIESPVGVKNKNNKLTYDHTLYLIELTKILEGYICDSLTFTNALGNDFVNS